MRFKLTLLLLILNATLVAIIYYLDKVQSTQDLMDESTRLILNPDFVESIDQISIHSTKNAQPWILKRGPEQWLVDSPHQWKANPYAVQQLIFQLHRLSWESRFPVADLASSGQSLESYNLENPPVRINLNGNGVSLTLALGSPTEIGNRLYLMSPDGEFVYVVPRGLLESLENDLSSFLDKRIFGLSVEETRALQIQDRASSNVRVRLERNRDSWRFVSPIETAADSERVRSLLLEWESIELDGFEAGKQIPPGMEGNTIRLTLEGVSERETLILTPPPADQQDSAIYYLARREAYPAVFRIDAEKVRELRSVQEALREKRVLAKVSDNWTSLEIQFGNLGLTLQKLENGTWQVLYTDEQGQLRTQPADQEAIQTMTQLLQTMEAERFITDAPSEGDLARFGLNEPQRRLRVRTGNQTSVGFSIGGLYPEGDKTLLYASTDQSDSVFLVRPFILSTLALDPFKYRERQIRNLPDTAVVQSITLIHRTSGLPVSLEIDPGDSVQKEDVLQALRSFVKSTRVERFLNRPFSDPLVLDASRQIEWKFLVQAEVTYSTLQNRPTETIQLYLSERLGGMTQYVGDPETKLVGTLPIPLIEVLDPYLAEYPDPPVSTDPEPEPESTSPTP